MATQFFLEEVCSFPKGRLKKFKRTQLKEFFPPIIAEKILSDKKVYNFSSFFLFKMNFASKLNSWVVLQTSLYPRLLPLSIQTVLLLHIGFFFRRLQVIFQEILCNTRWPCRRLA